MILSAELVERFLTDRCNKEEADFVTAYFGAHPDELEHYMGEDEWRQFEVGGVMKAAMDRQVWQHIRVTALRRSSVVRQLYRWSAAAAAVLVVVGGGWWYFGKTVFVPAVVVKIQQVDTAFFAVVSNSTTGNKEIRLEDGSTVTLAANSSLRWQRPFARNQRLMGLEGKAFFKVAKDAGRPFVVAAGGLTTTVLGTSFWVESFKERPTLHVRLITGKVVIQKAAHTGGQFFQPVYLTPGQQLAFDRESQRSIVSVIAAGTGATTAVVVHAEKANRPVLVFDQEPLASVLHALEKRYHTTILFDEQQVANMKFSGSYTDSDKVEDILNTIVLINGLKLEQTATGYTIRQ